MNIFICVTDVSGKTDVALTLLFVNHTMQVFCYHDACKYIFVHIDYFD